MGKQFNIKGQNGLYLSNGTPSIYSTDVNNDYYYKKLLIEDYDFFPKNQQEANLFDLKNVKYRATSSQLYGSNSIAKSNSSLSYSYIFKKGELIPNKKYFNSFKMYFNFGGSVLGSYVFPGFSGTSAASISAKVLNALRVKVYIQLGAQLFPATLTNLEQVVSNGSATWTGVTSSDRTGTIADSGNAYTGRQLATGLNSQSCVDMRWSTSALFTNLSTNGYGFRMDVSIPSDKQQALKTKDYKIIIKYYNIGHVATGVPTLYTTSESVELMSNNYIYYERINIPIYTSPLGGGGTSDPVEASGTYTEDVSS